MPEPEELKEVYCLFAVFDAKHGCTCDAEHLSKLALEEKEFKSLLHCDMDCFRVDEDGAIFMCDETGQFVEVDPERFKLVFNTQFMEDKGWLYA